jgi:hypothetical protein
LIAVISPRACLLPTVSVSHAAFIVKSRAISISIRVSDPVLNAGPTGQRLAERHP